MIQTVPRQQQKLRRQQTQQRQHKYTHLSDQGRPLGNVILIILGYRIYRYYPCYGSIGFVKGTVKSLLSRNLC